MQVKKEIFDKIKGDTISKQTTKPWPVTGGQSPEATQGIIRISSQIFGKILIFFFLILGDAEDLLITGHEDGSVKFWACSSIAMSLLATIKTAKYFLCDDLDAPRDDEGKF